MAQLRFKVPQNVQREDTILWFITLRQLIILMVGGGISYVMFVQLGKHYYLNMIQQVLIWVPAGIAAAIAFIQIKGLSLINFCLAFGEHLLQPRHRYWIAGGGTPHLSSTVNFNPRLSKKAPKKTHTKSSLNSAHIKSMADLVDKPSTES